MSSRQVLLGLALVGLVMLMALMQDRRVPNSLPPATTVDRAAESEASGAARPRPTPRVRRDMRGQPPDGLKELAPQQLESLRALVRGEAAPTSGGRAAAGLEATAPESSAEVPRASTDPWEAGFDAYVRRDFAAAAEHFAAVPSEHPQFAKAQRLLGYNISVREHGNALVGIVYLKRSLLEDPWNGNIWQDLARAGPRAALEAIDLLRAPPPLPQEP